MGTLSAVYLTLDHYEAGSAALIALVASSSVGDMSLRVTAILNDGRKVA